MTTPVGQASSLILQQGFQFMIRHTNCGNDEGYYIICKNGNAKGHNGKGTQ
jgi:hypothetical protein